MFTDFYITNTSLIRNQDYIVFFQKKIKEDLPNTTLFKSVQNCQYNWSHKIRVFWDLSCRFVDPSGNTSSVYNLKTTYTKQRPFFFISKQGTISIQQSYGNGNQILGFEKIRGNQVFGVQLYRGELLIGEDYFEGKYLALQVDTIISVAIYNREIKYDALRIEEIKNVLEIDFIGLKSVYITLTGNKNKGNKVQVDAIDKW
jgi:hypothetical protein